MAPERMSAYLLFLSSPDMTCSLFAAAVTSYTHNAFACVTETSVIYEAALLDWRYFFVNEKDGTGRSTSGLARRALAEYLRGVSNHTEFLSPTWFHKLETSGSNPSILGFYTERMVISSLATKGHELVLLGPNFQHMVRKQARPWRIQHFLRGLPILSKDIGVTMYIPIEFNYKAVDAIAVSISAKGIAEILGIQITIANRHSNSELLFFSNWEVWKKQLNGFEPKAKFLWIWENPRDVGEIQLVASSVRWDGKIIKLPDRLSISASVRDINKDIGDTLQRAREAARGGVDHELAARQDEIDAFLAKMDAELEGTTAQIEEGPADMDPALAAEGDRIGGPSLKRKRSQDSLTSPQPPPRAETGSPPLSSPEANPPAGSRRKLRSSSRRAGGAGSATTPSLGVASRSRPTSLDGGGRAAKDRKGKGRA